MIHALPLPARLRILLSGAVILAVFGLPASAHAASTAHVLGDSALESWVGRFNAEDDELYTNAFPNAKALKFLAANIPLFECPDEDLERTYYFRWWTYRKHVRESPDGWVITEFLPKVSWSARHNTISCPAGHHFYEGRWLADPQYLDDYAVFWFRKGGSPRQYSFWAADAIHAYYLANGNKALVIDLLDELNKEAHTTLVMVTHDLSLAQRTPRVIRLAGGEIVSDERTDTAEAFAGESPT